MKQREWRKTLLVWSAWLAQVCFLQQSRTTHLGVPLSTVDPPTQIPNQEYALQTSLPTSLMEALSLLRAPFLLITVACVKLTKTNQHAYCLQEHLSGGTKYYFIFSVVYLLKFPKFFLGVPMHPSLSHLFL